MHSLRMCRKIMRCLCHKLHVYKIQIQMLIKQSIVSQEYWKTLFSHSSRVSRHPPHPIFPILFSSAVACLQLVCGKHLTALWFETDLGFSRFSAMPHNLKEQPMSLQRTQSFCFWRDPNICVTRGLKIWIHKTKEIAEMELYLFKTLNRPKHQHTTKNM